MNKNKWYRYRSMSSSGYSHWNYVCIPDCLSKEKITNYIEENCSDVPTWSEHYRKVEWKRCVKLPAKILETEIRNAKLAIADYKKLLESLEAMTPSKTDHNELERNRQKRKWNAIYRKQGLLHLIQK